MVDPSLINAVEDRRVITFRYLGSNASGLRTVRPHVIYRSSTGKICLDGLQVEGATSSSAPLPSWRPFDTALMRDISILDERFEPDARLNLLNRKRYVEVIASP